MNSKTTLKGLSAALALALPLSSQAMMLSNGDITISMESWEQFIPGYGAAIGVGDVAPGAPVAFYNNGAEDLRGTLNVLGTSQIGASNSYENISQTLAKTLGGESLTGVMYGLDASYAAGIGSSLGKFGYTGGIIDLYLDNPANESVAGGPSGFTGGPPACIPPAVSCNYPTFSDGTATLILRLAFTVGNDTLSLFGPNTGATLYGTVKPTLANGSSFFFEGSSAGFLDVIGGSMMAAFDTDSIPVGPTGSTAAKFADFSFSNNFGTECMSFGLPGTPALGTHIDGCGDPQFAQVGFDGLVPNGEGLWNTQDQGPAVGSRQVPEPNVLALVGLSMLGLSVVRRKGRKQA
jgi:hypothetical protein